MSFPSNLFSLLSEFRTWDITQCRTGVWILKLDSSLLDLDECGGIFNSLSLSTKASLCCRKHLEMTLSSSEESQEEEHANIFFQAMLLLLLESSSAIPEMMITCVGGKGLMLTAEKFVVEQLNLVKASILDIKRINSIASEVMKSVQEVLNSSVKLCKTYAQVLKSEADGMIDDKNGTIDGERLDNVNYVGKLLTFTTDFMYELGIIAATADANLVTILNISWKGVVALLQLGNEGLAAKVNVADIISSLISLATGSLKHTAESWSSKCKEGVTVNEAKRSVLPVKFYLINAVRILSQCPCKVSTIYKDITQCVLMISTLGISLCREPHLKASSEALVEFLEPTSCCLLHTLLISDEVEQETKFKILNWLFTDEKHSSYASPGEANRSPTFMEGVFTLYCDNMPRERALILGQVSLFLNLLRSSPDLKEDGIIGISQKLEWFFHCLIDEDVYSSILVLKIPVFLSRAGSSPGLVWQCLFSSLLLALKVFVVVASPSVAWGNVEFFLLENFLHPHFLIWEINMELWCFIVRGAGLEMVNDIMCKLCSLFKLMASFRPFPANICALRKMARSICMLLSYATQPSIDQVYCFISDDRSPAACIMYVALLMEGFPLKSLSDGLKKHAIHRIISSYHSFIEKNEKKLQVDGPSRSFDSYILCAPVYAISSALQYHQVNSADVNEKTLKFIITTINGYKGAMGVLKEVYCKLLSKSLAIVSNAKHLYASDVMQEVILELQPLFGTKNIGSDVLLDHCKPDLSFFMAGLARMDIKEDEGSTIYSALWDMYGMLLRERHWANIHLAISAFGYFAARTSCNQLWRFVPQDAALSFDPNTGNVTDDRFMSELKAFLDKEGALLVVTPSTEQYAILVKEALILKETVDKISNIKLRDSSPDIMEIDSESHVTKKRKLPDGISEGVVLLQSGLKVMGDGLAQLQQQQHGSHDLHEKFSTQLSRLEDVIYHLVGLAGDV
ncbi:hypothetical protein Syun_006467 [Stephania yunnanensis]|uniref:Uncharacterized protein n=1 Tax=Stephania yunnanensis TaxID=152371 RepID=A0AAP0KWX8_9MAGN